MIKQSIALLALSSALLTSQPLLADSTHGHRYAGANVGFMDIGADGSNKDAGINHIEARMGGYVNDYLAAEARLGTGITDDTVDGVDFSLRYLVGAYVRAGYPITEQVFPYVALGFSRVDVKAENSSGGNSTNNAETDASYGVGIDAVIAKLSLTAEYMNYVDKDGWSYSGFAVGFTTKF